MMRANDATMVYLWLKTYFAHTRTHTPPLFCSFSLSLSMSWLESGPDFRAL